MAVRLEAANAGYLAYPAGINLKPALNNAGADQGYGHFCAAFVELPWAAGSNIQSFLWGHDANKGGSWTQAGADHFLTVGGPNTGGNPSMKNRMVTASALSGAVNGWPAATRNWSGMAPRVRSAMGESRIYLVGHGILNLGTAETPDWRFFRFAWPQVGGSAAGDTYIDATAKTNADGYVAGATTFLSQIFNSVNSIAHVGVEWLGVFRGNFPTTGSVGGGDYALDTSVLQNLMDGAATYKTQAALRAWAGSAATIVDLRPLLNGDLTAVADSTSAGKATALVATGTAAAINTNAGVIAAAWADLSIEAVRAGAPAIGFWGGRGQVAPVVRGRKPSGVAQLQCRVESAVSGLPVAGLDWQDLAFTGETSWSATLPASPPVGGPYRLRIRDKANTALEATSGAPIYVGCTVAHWGQSQVELGFNTATPFEASVAANCWALTLIDEGGNQNHQAMSGTVYTRPSGSLISINAADNPQRAGLVAFANEWTRHNSDEPLLVVNMGLKTYGLYNQWAPEGVAWRGEGLSLPPNMPGAPTGSAWYCWGNNANLPGAAGGENSGLVTAEAIILDRYLDAILFDLGTADATLAKPNTPTQYNGWGNGAYQDWEANFAACASYLRTTFFSRSASVPILIAPFGRYNTSAAQAWMLRDKQYQRAVTALDDDLGGFIGDCLMDNGSVGSPHPRHGYSPTSPPAGLNAEVTDEGQQRRMRRLATQVCRHFDTSIQAIGPRMLKWWRDEADAKVAWIETGWQAGLKTQAGPPYAEQDLPEFYYSSDGTWASAEGSYHASLNPAGGFTARLDLAFPTRIKLTRLSGIWPSTTGAAAIEYCRSSIFDSSAGAKIQEKDTQPIDQAGAVMRARDALDLLVYGEAVNDGGRGIMLRQAFGTINGAGLVQSAPPRLGLYRLVMTEKVAPGPRTLTLNRKNANGEVIATQTVEVVVS